MFSAYLHPWLLLLRRLLFWMGLFFSLRLILLMGRLPQIRLEGISWVDTALAFVYALRLDLATASYFLIAWWLISFLFLWKKDRIAAKIDYWLSGVLIILLTLIYVSEIAIFKEWGSKVTWKALVYLRNPMEVVRSAGPGLVLIMLIIITGLSVVGIHLYIRTDRQCIQSQRSNRLSWFIFILLSPGIIFIGLRGGVGAIPINQSKAYFSAHYTINSLAVNSAFHLAKDYLESHRFDGSNPFATLDDSIASQVVRELHTPDCDSSVKILQCKRPNIVLIILESWTADAISSLGGAPGITPAFDSLANEGMLFSRCYVSGNRSQQAMASIFSGFPALPQTAVTHHYDKFIQLPSMVQSLANEGYSSLFVFGGDLAYGGMKAYMLFNGFEHIIEGKDFSRNIKRGYLGVHDGQVFDRFIEETNKLSQPFLASVFTLSSHSPYDQPWPQRIKGYNQNQDFLNAVNYTDHCLADFFSQASQTYWFDSTLFILVSDHSHFSHIPRTVHDAAYHHIPMLWLGPALKPGVKGSRYDQISSQTDLATTVLTQLDIPIQDFGWSRNLFNPCIQEFAYFEHNQGFGWIRPQGTISYNVFLNHFYEANTTAEHQDRLLLEGKAYLQVLFSTFQGL